MDRRVFTRIEIPGAQIQYKKIGARNILNILSKPVDIRNLSKSGLCFPIDNSLKYGDAILMKIHFPDGKQFRLKGQIRWYNANTSDNQHVGVQFHPFGEQHEYNPIEALEYLRRMNGLDIVKPEHPEQ